GGSRQPCPTTPRSGSGAGGSGGGAGASGGGAGASGGGAGGSGTGGAAAPVPEPVDFNPKGKNLIFKEVKLNAGQLREKWPFRQDLNTSDPPNLVQHGDDYHVMQGNHRTWTAQNPPKGEPLTIKARIWTPQEWEAHSGMPFV